MGDPVPTELAEAERTWKGQPWLPVDEAAALLRRFADQANTISPTILYPVLAELDRLRAVEQAAAAYVRAGLCGDYHPEIPDSRREYSERYAALVAAVRTNGAFNA